MLHPSRILSAIVVILSLNLCARQGSSAPKLRDEGAKSVVEGAGYRVLFAQDTLDMGIELKTVEGKWQPLTKTTSGLTFGVMQGANVLQSNGMRATRAITTSDNAITIARQASLNPVEGSRLELYCICTDDGVLIGTRVTGLKGAGILWSPPRLALKSEDWDGYVFYAADGQRHAGDLSALQPLPGYAGVSPWDKQGDTVQSLNPKSPALAVLSHKLGMGLGVVFMDHSGAWAGSSCFLQRYSADSLYLYAGYSTLGSSAAKWAWLAPFPAKDIVLEAKRIEDLLASGSHLIEGFKPNAPPVPESWYKPVADFPASLRHAEPVKDINSAAVYTMNEGESGGDYSINLARKVGSDMLIRSWFKWNQAPDVSKWTVQPIAAHKMGALFGGGITCSALYDNENGLTQQQVTDMATRGPDGKLVDAWGQPGIRHGSLSCPAYLDYLFRWCKEQIDAGVDYLFMDETNAALSDKEGYDDRSLADFRSYLINSCSQTRGWKLDDVRWHEKLGITLTDPAICPSGRMDTFDYRAYMRAGGFISNPNVVGNKLAGLWADGRTVRDNKAWKTLTDRIRAYGKEKGRRILLSGNGIVPYVDLQVLGVWDRWTTDNGHVDLRANQLGTWHALVTRAQTVAGSKVSVVLFHDWGMGDTPFPWMAVAPSEREVWMRTRGAEIYAAGGFFAFPVEGPFGCDCSRDGTLPLIAHLTNFYQRNRDTYLKSRWLGSDCVKTTAPLLSLSAGWWTDARTLILHVINRDVKAGVLKPRGAVEVELPVNEAPISAFIVSPDFEGERAAACRVVGGGKLQVTLPALDAYSVVLLRYKSQPNLSRITDPVKIRLDGTWSRPERSDFTVLPDGSVTHSEALSGFLQGMLHTELRNPPVFTINAGQGAQAQVHVRAVATAGAKLQFSLDGKTVKIILLPDLDGKNDGAAIEYDKTFTCPIPAGRHKLKIDNVGGDWLTADWYSFSLGMK